MKQQTAMQKLWDWIDANCHEDNFNLNDAKEMSLKLEKEQIEDAHIEGQRVFDNHPHSQWNNDQAEVYYNKTYVEDK